MRLESRFGLGEVPSKPAPSKSGGCGTQKPLCTPRIGRLSCGCGAKGIERIQCKRFMGRSLARD